MADRFNIPAANDFPGRRIGGTLYRWAFLVCVYTGLRALFNRLRGHLLCGRSCVTQLHDTTIRTGRYGALRIFVHRQSRQVKGLAGMLSLRQEQPTIHVLLYRYLCMTSHFACGHLEVAYCEAEGQVTIYAARNSARSNAHRLGWKAVAQQLGSERNDVHAVRTIVAQLEELGLTVRMAPPQECVQLALDSRLVNPKSLPGTKATLERKYRRLVGALNLPSHESTAAHLSG